MTIPADWNEVWKQLHSRPRDEMHDPEFWNKRAPSFARHASGSDYIYQFIVIMDPAPDWSVLDIGCAAGTLAVPLSPLVNSITAVDPSTAMLSLLAERCREQSITNIRSVQGRWEDDWDAFGIGMHDVVMASRSLITDDLQGAIRKLDSRARKCVYLSALVDDGPYDRRIVEAAGRSFSPRADYIVVYNLLRQMGYYANVAFTVTREEKTYQDIEDAVNSLKWMIHNITAEEEKRLGRFLEKYLVCGDGGLKLPQPKVVRWAVMWWDKEAGQAPKGK